MRFLERARERAKHKRALAPHLSSAALKSAGRSHALLTLNAEKRTVSFLNCRIRGFEAIAQSFGEDSEGLARVARLVMTPLSKAVLEREGTIDGIMPGALTAYFNAPLDDVKHAVHVCGCALAMLAALEKINVMLDRMLRLDGSAVGGIGIGVGIDTGEAIMGNFGTEDRPAYRALSGAAEQADAFEKLSARYGTSILVGAATRGLVEEHLADKTFAFLEVDHLTLASGESAPLFALLGSPLSRANPKFLALKAFHDRIFEAYRAHEWERARALIAQARALSGANPVLYDLYLKRIADFESRPPGGGRSSAYAKARS
jgi:adenylate cyclase